MLSTLPSRPVEVILDHDASEHLAVGDAGTYDVWFGPAASSSSDRHTRPQAEDTADQPVTVFRGEYKVGVLDRDSSAAWRPLLHEGRTVTTFATRRQAETGEWRLFVGLPLERSKRPGYEGSQNP
ncbi:MAG: hypothetical protein LBI49_05700 [Nocardiopsaceae bacterium]|nr:hypothetical protein [Nocardiopsaceae bacterium]